MKSIIYAVIFMSACSISLNAQEVSDQEISSLPQTSGWNMYLRAGTGIINGEDPFKPGVIGGVGIEHSFKGGFGISLDIDGGALTLKAKEGFSYEGKTTFIQAAPILKYNFSFGNSGIGLGPFVGAGLIRYNPVNTLNGQTIRYADGTPADPKGVNGMVIPLGIQIAKTTSKVSLGLEIYNNYLDSVRFDGIVGTYGSDAERPNKNPRLYEGKIIDYEGDVASPGDTWIGIRFFVKIPLGKSGGKDIAVPDTEGL